MKIKKLFGYLLIIGSFILILSQIFLSGYYLDCFTQIFNQNSTNEYPVAFFIGSIIGMGIVLGLAYVLWKLGRKLLR